jgi:hypothetical protein
MNLLTPRFIHVISDSGIEYAINIAYIMALEKYIYNSKEYSIIVVSTAPAAIKVKMPLREVLNEIRKANRC